MPADSDPARDLPGLPRTWRPLGPRVAGWVVTVALFVVLGVGWFSFDAETRAKFTYFQRGTLVVLALTYLALILALTRSRAVAERDRLIVINGFRRREFAWAEIVAVRLPPGAPWVTLDLTDGGTAAVLGIQGSDGARARAAVRELRALVAAVSD